MEACDNSYLSKIYVVPRLSSGWSETQTLFSKKSLKKYLVPLGALVTSKAQVVPDTSIVGDDKIGVLLLNLGGPETLEDVQPFLFNLFADPVMSSLLCLICIK
jgi:ferrochelatase